MQKLVNHLVPALFILAAIAACGGGSSLDSSGSSGCSATELSNCTSPAACVAVGGSWDGVACSSGADSYVCANGGDSTDSDLDLIPDACDPCPVPESTTFCQLYGNQGATFPNWQERAAAVLTNSVRMAPLAYRSSYGADFQPSLAPVLSQANYPAVDPLYYLAALNQAARSHSDDMNSNCGSLQHNSCDGTDSFVRIAGFYPCGGDQAENIAYSSEEGPRLIINQWLCDSTGDVCCADGASCDGHRRNIMAADYKLLGVGYSAPDQLGHTFTQDFGANECSGNNVYKSKLVDGSHIFYSGEIRFLATFFDSAGSAPHQVRLVLAGVSHPMTLDMGAASRGTYRWATAEAAGCRSYHFEAVDANNFVYRYPASGELRSTGEGGCGETYTP